MAVVTQCCQHHEGEREGGEVVVEEKDAGEEEVGQIVQQPAHQQHRTTRTPVHKHL